jgi:hypothetical protein
MPKWTIFHPWAKPPTFATIDDLHELECRLLRAIVDGVSGDKNKIAELTVTLNTATAALKRAVDQNKPTK